ncbi:MAG: serine protease [Acidimicrobiales bacterium]
MTAGCVAKPPSTPVAKPSTSIVRADSIERHEREFTVRFRSTRCANAGVGSGIVVGQHEIITNRHVAAGSVKLEVNSWDGQTYHVISVRIADKADLALVTVQEALPVVAPIRTKQASKGSDVTIVGYPEGNQLRFVKGQLGDTVSGSEFQEPNPVEELSGQVEPGNSGGPVLDKDGKVTGVVFAMVVATGRGLAINLDTLKQFLKDGGTPDHVTC